MASALEGGNIEVKCQLIGVAIIFVAAKSYKLIKDTKIIFLGTCLFWLSLQVLNGTGDSNQANYVSKLY